MPVAMNLQTMVSYGIGVVIAGGKDVDGVIRDELHRMTCSSAISDCYWTTMEQKLKQPRWAHVSMLIPDSLAKDLCIP